MTMRKGPLDRDWIEAMLAQGAHPNDIHRRTGASGMTIRKIAREMGLVWIKNRRRNAPGLGYRRAEG